MPATISLGTPGSVFFAEYAGVPRNTPPYNPSTMSFAAVARGIACSKVVGIGIGLLSDFAAERGGEAITESAGIQGKAAPFILGKATGLTVTPLVDMSHQTWCGEKIGE